MSWFLFQKTLCHSRGEKKNRRRSRRRKKLWQLHTSSNLAFLDMVLTDRRVGGNGGIQSRVVKTHVVIIISNLFPPLVMEKKRGGDVILMGFTCILQAVWVEREREIYACPESLKWMDAGNLEVDTTGNDGSGRVVIYPSTSLFNLWILQISYSICKFYRFLPSSRGNLRPWGVFVWVKIDRGFWSNELQAFHQGLLRELACKRYSLKIHANREKGGIFIKF